jgi:hypothetical protein
MYRDNDRDWLQRVYNFTWNADDYPFTAAPDFLNSCLTASGVDGYILYSYSAQQALVPMIATAAGVLNAVPLDVDTQLGLLEGVPAALVMDFTEEWGGFSPLDATRYCYEKYIGETTGMAKQNPGYAYPHNENLPDKLPVSKRPSEARERGGEGQRPSSAGEKGADDVNQRSDLAGRRGGSGGLPPTTLSLARFRRRRAPLRSFLACPLLLRESSASSGVSLPLKLLGRRERARHKCAIVARPLTLPRAT